MTLTEKDRRINLVRPGERSPKIIHAGPQWDGQPFLAVSEGCIVLGGSLDHGIISDKEFGTTIQGPISLSEMPEYISFCGGFWRLNPAVLTSIGSSAAMNIPMLVPDEPELLKFKNDLADIYDGITF
jgi:hypothetical protein